MNLIDVLFLAVALSIDATAVAFAYGMCFNEKRLKNSFSLAAFCGVFQGIMPIIGYFVAGTPSRYYDWTGLNKDKEKPILLDEIKKLMNYGMNI